jgi:hypothetical protein
MGARTGSFSWKQTPKGTSRLPRWRPGARLAHPERRTTRFSVFDADRSPAVTQLGQRRRSKHQLD